MPETAVGAYARRLRQAGKLSSSGRGLGGADMTAHDCSNLLIAVMSGSPTRAVERLKLYGALISSPNSLGDLSQALLNAINLEKGHSFSKLISTLISTSIETSIETKIQSYFADAVNIGPENEDILWSAISLTVKFPRPETIFSFSSFLHEHFEKQNECWLYYMPRKEWKKIEARKSENLDYGDLDYKLEVSHRTINALGNLLADRRQGKQ